MRNSYDAFNDDDADGATVRRRAVRKTASKRTASKSAPAVTDPNEKRVMKYLTAHGESHEDTIADHIAAQVGGQVDTESIVHDALRALASRKMVRSVRPGVWVMA